MEEAPHNTAIRFYSGKLSITRPTIASGKEYSLLNLPYYRFANGQIYQVDV